MAPQLVTEQDRENYGDELIGMSQRAAYDAVRPELERLHAENQNLRSMAQRSQRAEIERALDSQVSNWRSIYANPAFADWLSQPDDYSAATRSQLLRNAVSNGDAGRVVAFYRGFQQNPAGQARSYPRGSSPRAATGARPIYTRQQIANLYERRRKGEFNDARWAQIEADIIAAGREGRVTSSFDKYGNEVRLV
jgi:hypothetical protein